MAGAQSGTYCEFLGPAGSTGEQEVCHINARNQEHKPHRTQQHEEGRPGVAHNMLLERVQGRAETPVEVRIGAGKVLGHHRHVGPRLFNRHCGFEPGDAVNSKSGSAVGERVGIPLPNRNIYIPSIEAGDY